MKLTVTNGLRAPTTVEGTQVVVRSGQGDVLAVLLEPMPGSYIVLRANDPQFEQTLMGLGLAVPQVHEYKSSQLHLPS